MKTLAPLLIHVLTTLAKRAGPGGAKAIIAESVLLKHQQLIARRSAGKTPRMTTSDRFLCGFLVLFMHPGRIRKAAIVLKPATLTKYRRALLSRNYHRLFSSRKNAKPGPPGRYRSIFSVTSHLSLTSGGWLSLIASSLANESIYYNYSRRYSVINAGYIAGLNRIFVM